MLRCYLSVPAKTSAASLRHVLSGLSVHVDPADRIPPSGESLPGAISRRLQRADFVCAVLPRDAVAAGNVLFELGIAAGLGRPVFIISEKGSVIPVGLQAYPFVEADLGDTDAIRFHLQVFLTNIARSVNAALSSPRPLTGGSKLSSTRASQLLYRAADPKLSTRDLHRIVAEALEGLGAHVITDAKLDRRARADIVAWIPNAPPDLGAPFLVEVMSSHQPAGYSAGKTQLARHMALARIRTGLLVTTDGSREIAVNIVASGYVFVVSTTMLIKLAEDGQLIKHLVETRNRSAHSMF
jgi:hypothetical protein